MRSSSLPPTFSILDSTQSVFAGDILYPFAIDEIFCRQVGEGKRSPLVHIWRHEKAFVLGLRDRKLPNAQKAMDWLSELGYSVTVRNSGGAAVPLDSSVLNLSVILPNPAQKIDFHHDFELMYEIIRKSLSSYGVVNKGEVTGAYCPGDFDLSIGGKKFCGIAQRRQIKAYVVQAFIVVEGSGERRAQLVKDFYETAMGNEVEVVGLGSHPQVTHGSMISLQEACGVDSVYQYHQHLVDYLCRMGGQVGCADHEFRLLTSEIREMIETLRVRYEKRV
ncbi:MAG TPA: biotin--protein ligase [Bacillota bacterium]|nr:biotin--protein ligase [Bacillota bacterium]